MDGMRALVLNCSPVRNGATAAIASMVAGALADRYTVRSACIDDFRFGFCTGCRRCHETAACFQRDGVDMLLGEFARADVIVAVSPSYWADVPGQFKAFIDRCTPWSNTHEPHATLGAEKRGYAIALRTGPGMRECEGVLESIEHFYGHLEIARCGRLGLCGVGCREDADARREEILDFCRGI